MMHLEPQAQIEAKRGILLESLRRSGGLEFQDEVHSRSGPELGYRSRARFHVKTTRQGPLVGFKERKSDRVVDVNRCLLISDRANETLRKVRRWFDDGPRRAAAVSQFEILRFTLNPGLQKSSDSGRILLHFVVNKERGLSRVDLESLLREGELEGLVVTEVDAAESQWRARIGQSKTMHRVGDIEYQTRVGSFFQVNRFLLEELVEEVVPPDPVALDDVVDLYCGVGLFSLPLARCARYVRGVESSSAAVFDAKANARRNGVENVEFSRADVCDYVAREGLGGASFVVVDPPRSGLGRPVVEALEKRAPRELRYVSCDPAALGRDAGRLSRGGLELQRVVVIELFPNTHHFETVATFLPCTN
jgi:23S rRNA (uracil1939-C5)-methyltransferase